MNETKEQRIEKIALNVWERWSNNGSMTERTFEVARRVVARVYREGKPDSIIYLRALFRLEGKA